MLIVFAAALFLLLRDMAESVTLAIIDQEYIGHDALIKDRLLRLLRTEGLHVYPDCSPSATWARSQELTTWP